MYIKPTNRFMNKSFHKIYRLSAGTDYYYYGKTKTISNAYGRHYKNTFNRSGKSYHTKLYSYIRSLGITRETFKDKVLIEFVVYVTKASACNVESNYINLDDDKCLNSMYSIRKISKKEYKDKKKVYDKEYRKLNKDKRNTYDKAYRKVHYQKNKESQKEYRDNNKDKKKAYDKAYRERKKKEKLEKNKH